MLEKEKKEKKEHRKTFKNSTLYLACQYYQEVENSFENIKTLLDLGFRLQSDENIYFFNKYSNIEKVFIESNIDIEKMKKKTEKYVGE